MVGRKPVGGSEFVEWPNGYLRWTSDKEPLSRNITAHLRSRNSVTVEAHLTGTYIGHELTPALARELAASLNLMADSADEWERTH